MSVVVDCELKINPWIEQQTESQVTLDERNLGGRGLAGVGSRREKGMECISSSQLHQVLHKDYVDTGW